MDERRDFAIAAMADYVDFAKKHPEIYQSLLEKLEVEQGFFEKNRNLWVSSDFFEQLLTTIEEQIKSQPHHFNDMDLDAENFVFSIMKETHRRKSLDFFRFAASVLVEPGFVLSRLPKLASSVNNYNTISVEIIDDGMLYTKARVSHICKDTSKQKFNRWIGEMAHASLYGLFDALGANLLSVQKVADPDRGEEYGEYEVIWVNKKSRKSILFFAAIFISMICLLQFGLTLGWAHSAMYSFLISLTSYLVIRARSDFRKIDEAFELQRDSLEKLSSKATSLKRLNDELMNTQKDMETAVQLAAAGELSYGYLHDMSSSISVILMSSRILNKAIDREEMAQGNGRYLRMVESAANQLVKMQNLVRKAVTPGQNSGTQMPIPVNTAISDTLELVLPLMETKQIELTVDLESTQESLVLANEGVLEGIALNLLHNAINVLSEVNTRKIEISTRKLESDIELVFGDSGPGVPEKVLDTIARPFNSNSKKDKGDSEVISSGFGLYKIKRSIVDMGGSFEIESSSQGTQFIIRLPEHAQSRSVA